MATSLKADAHHHEPAILPFDWADPYDLEHQLTEEERLVRDTAENYAQEKLQPRVTSAYMDERFDREIMSEMGELGLLGATVPAGIWRSRPRLRQLRPHRPRCRARRQRLSLGLLGPVQPRDVPDLRLRIGGAAPEVPARPRPRRAGRLLRPDRAGLRLRSREACAPGRRRPRTATASPAPRCGSPTRPSPTSSSSGRSRKRMAARSAASCSKRAWPASPRRRSRRSSRSAPRSPARS